LGAAPTPAVALVQVLWDLDVPDGTGHIHQTAALGQELRNGSLRRSGWTTPAIRWRRT
jgi:hypothetical protein